MWNAQKNIINILYKKHYLKNIDIEKYTKILDILFPHAINNQQKIAVALTLIKNITFILGSPGTGKSTTILKIIIALIKSSNKPIKIILAAPTGKAANRLEEILQDNIFNILLNKKEQKNIPSIAITIHKLLKITKISQKTPFHEKNPLKIDVLIIDETSMIDILMMQNILCAVSEYTKIIFIGDSNQLSPIETGSFLKDISSYANNYYSLEAFSILKKITKYHLLKNKTLNHNIFFNDNICILEKNYRFNKHSGIYILSNAILKKKNKIINLLFNNSLQDITYFHTNTKIEYKKMINNIIEEYQEYWKQINNQEKIDKIIKTFQTYQVLCFILQGKFGVNILNKQLEYNMYKKNIIKYINQENKKWYIGKPIMITRNNEYFGLSNGNIGISNLNSKGILQVSFLGRKNYIINIPAKILKDYETAWAITVHKAQGSEFNNTTVVLPNYDNNIFTNDLLYTATTRSKKKLSIYCIKEIFMKIVQRTSQKNNTLLDYIKKDHIEKNT